MRTVPTTESEELELYERTYYSLLRSTAEVKLRTLEEVHAATNSLLHPAARSSRPDMAAFIYSILRLPACMPELARQPTRLVVLGQNAGVFEAAGFGDVRSWEEVYAPARRRRCFYDGQGVLACFIASRSDIDDLIPLLTAYQIEWNKLHNLLQRASGADSLRRQVGGAAAPNPYRAETDPRVGDTGAGTRPAPLEGVRYARYARLAEQLEIPTEDFDRLYAIWDRSFVDNLERIAAGPCDLRVRLLSASLSEYRRARNAWWASIEQAFPQVRDRPVYFVSSNTHSLANILSGFALQHTDRLVTFLEQPGNAGLLSEWKDIQAGRAHSSRENFLYYLLKKYEQTSQGHDLAHAQQKYEHSSGILRIPGRRSFDVEAQVFDLAKLDLERADPRLKAQDVGTHTERHTTGHVASAGQRAHTGPGQPQGIPLLRNSDALILNIDYPLGLAAYDILAEVSSNAGPVLGVYIMGKAATLNAVIGDAMVSNVVHDEHSQNTFLFPNCFSAADVSPDLAYGSVLDNQKSVTVRGTFLQNASYMDVFYREGYTVIEMEAGPYLSAIYEMHRPDRHPVNEIINLYGLSFDLGLVHYASDTPLGKGKNLGAGSLSYMGMDATYAVTLAITRRILSLESSRIQERLNPRG